MALITNVAKELSPNAGLKVVQALTGLVDEDDTTTINLTSFGIKSLRNVISQAHATEGSVVVTEVPTTSVTAGVLTLTFPAGNDAKKRSVLVFGE